MIERAVGPGHRIVASRAGGREPGLDVIHGRGRVVVIGLVAVHAVSVGNGVVAVLRVMAVRALPGWIRMAVRQQKTGGRMIKFAVRPQHRIVAGRAGGREPGLDVIDRRSSVVVIGHVAIHAVAVGDVVIAELRVVAVRTLPGRIGVGVGQQKTGRRMIKFAVGPDHRIVTGFTSQRERGLDVIDRRDRVVVIGLVAVRAGPAGDVVVAELRVVAVGALTRRIRVGVCQ